VKTMDNAAFSTQLDTLPERIPVFGGGADAYGNSSVTAVFENGRYYRKGAVAAVFCGADLQITCGFSLGWKPLGRNMNVTDTAQGGMILKTVDDQPAVELYRKYLSLRTDRDFHNFVDIFPIMICRGGQDMARVPVSAYPDGSIQLGISVKQGERIRLGYGDPAMLLEQSAALAGQTAAFHPQAILLFLCITRKDFLKEFAACDVQPFAAAAPSAGFYTYGEIMRIAENVETMNCSLVCVGMREGDAETGKCSPDSSSPDESGVTAQNPFALDGHLSVIKRLVSLIEATTGDLEEANRQLHYFAEHDKLTGILNRGEIEKRLKLVLDNVQDDRYQASAIMIDIDDFKSINDTYGHDAGDCVLKAVSDLLMSGIRSYDFAGRWGGEEFLIVLPAADLSSASRTAERIRSDIAQHVFEEAGHVTVSIGVSEVRRGEKVIDFYRRVDEALYQAKRSGKNRVAAQ